MKVFERVPTLRGKRDMTGKSTVILCGGTGGLVAASLLRKRLGSEHKVILIDRDTKHRFVLHTSGS